MYQIALKLAWLACVAHGQPQSTESAEGEPPLKVVDATLSSKTLGEGHLSAEASSGRFLFAPQIGIQPRKGGLQAGSRTASAPVRVPGIRARPRVAGTVARLGNADGDAAQESGDRPTPVPPIGDGDIGNGPATIPPDWTDMLLKSGNSDFFKLYEEPLPDPLNIGTINKILGKKGDSQRTLKEIGALVAALKEQNLDEKETEAMIAALTGEESLVTPEEEKEAKLMELEAMKDRLNERIQTIEARRARMTNSLNARIEQIEIDKLKAKKELKALRAEKSNMDERVPEKIMATVAESASIETLEEGKKAIQKKIDQKKSEELNLPEINQADMKVGPMEQMFAMESANVVSLEEDKVAVKDKVDKIEIVEEEKKEKKKKADEVVEEEKKEKQAIQELILKVESEQTTMPPPEQADMGVAPAGKTIAAEGASLAGSKRNILLKVYGCTFGMIGVLISSFLNRFVAQRKASSGSKGEQTDIPGFMPCGDKLDKQISTLAFPAMVNFLLTPIANSVDLLCIGQLGSALAIAGQAAANQVITLSSSFLFVIPIVTTPRVAKAKAEGKTKELQAAVGEAMFVSGLLAMLVASGIWFQQQALLLATGTAKTLEFSTPYLVSRLPGLVCGVVSSAGISAFRGIMDTVTPLQIALFSNVINCVLNPLLMFTNMAIPGTGGMTLPGLGMGIAGAGVATTVSQIVAVVSLMFLLFRKKLLSWRTLLTPPSKESLLYFAKAGGAVQVRALALNVTFLTITKATQSMDSTGTSAAAHAITLQLYQLGSVLLFAISSVAQIIIPNEMARKVPDEEASGRVKATRRVASRLLAWGALVGGFLGVAQVAGLPLLGVFSPVPEVQSAARVPSMMAAFLQLVNGVCYIGEGLMVGLGSFGALAKSNVVAMSVLLALVVLGPGGTSLPAVWSSLSVFYGIRLFFAMRFHFFTGPLARRNINKKASDAIQTQELSAA